MQPITIMEGTNQKPMSAETFKKLYEGGRRDFSVVVFEWEVDLRGVDLEGADLRGADLIGADLRGADLRGANLWHADLVDADLEGADLRGADLIGADLRGADLRGAKNLGRANGLGFAVFGHTQVTNEQKKIIMKALESAVPFLFVVPEESLRR